MLAWAAQDQRLTVSHDRRTMRAEAEARIRRSAAMPGLILLQQDYPIGLGISDLVLITEVTDADEWHNLIVFMPL